MARSLISKVVSRLKKQGKLDFGYRKDTKLLLQQLVTDICYLQLIKKEHTIPSSIKCIFFRQQEGRDVRNRFHKVSLHARMLMVYISTTSILQAIQWNSAPDNEDWTLTESSAIHWRVPIQTVMWHPADSGMDWNSFSKRTTFLQDRLKYRWGWVMYVRNRHWWMFRYAYYL